MNAPSSTTVGARRAAASRRSFSRMRSSRGGWAVPERGSATSTRAALPAPPAIGFFKLATCRSAFVDLLQLGLGLLHGVFRLRALYAAGVHVDDDVLRVGLGSLGGRRAGMPEGACQSGRLTENLQRLVDLGPHRVLFPLLSGADAVALVDLEPLAVVRLLVQPSQEVLRQLLVLRVLHDAVLEGQVEGELARRSLRHERGVLDVLVERLALVVLDLVLLTLGNDVDRRAVEGRADLPGVKRPVVVGVVPRQPALVAGVLPEGLQELDGLDRALRVERDLLAARVDLGAAEIPEERIGERRRIAEAVAERLTHRLALDLELLAGLPVLVPGLRELLEADVVEPRPPIGDRVTAAAVRHRQPLAVHAGAGAEHVVEAALRLADRLGDVRDVDERVGVEMRPVPQELDDVGAGPRLDRGSDAWLQVVGVDELEGDLGSERLRRFGRLTPQLD